MSTLSRLQLPCSVEERLDISRLAADTAQVAKEAKVRVLVADDDPAFLEALRTMLEFDERLEVVEVAIRTLAGGEPLLAHAIGAK